MRPLRRQLALLLIGLCGAFAIVVFFTQRLIVLPVFASIERDGAATDIRRCEGALQRDLTLLSNTTNDWAAWDDFYVYLQDRNATFQEENLIDESFTNSLLNLIAIYDEDRELVWGETRDLETLEKIDLGDALATLGDSSNSLTSHTDVDDAKEGVLLTKLGPMIIAARPIITSKRQGPIRGSLVMGRLLTEAEIFALADRAQVKLQLWWAGQGALPDEARELFSTLPVDSTDPLIREAGSDTLHAYRVVQDLFGKPALLLRVEVPRVVTAQGNFAAQMATASSVLGGLLMVTLAGWVIGRRVIRPLQWMADHAGRVGAGGNLKARLGYGRNDEIGTLAAAFDRMVQSIDQARRQMLDTAHRAGMADVAGEVLHNVGNAVNSANASLETFAERMDGSKLDSLGKAVALLQSQAPHAGEFFAKDPRGPMLIDFLGKVSESLEGERTDNRAALARLRETIRHIRGVIAMQQSHVRQSDFVQEVDFSEVIDELLALYQDRMAAMGVEVERLGPPIPELSLNKGKLSQVLVNLIRNALDAMQGQSGIHRLTIAAAPIEGSGLGIEIRDTGQGIPESVRARLFTQGYTTKPGGNGIGLHFCANAIQSMGGQLTVHSAGPGQGAAFRIWLPGVIVPESSTADSPARPLVS